MDEAGKAYLLEVNTAPGMTSQPACSRWRRRPRYQLRTAGVADSCHHSWQAEARPMAKPANARVALIGFGMGQARIADVAGEFAVCTGSTAADVCLVVCGGASAGVSGAADRGGGDLQHITREQVQYIVKHELKGVFTLDLDHSASRLKNCRGYAGVSVRRRWPGPAGDCAGRTSGIGALGSQALVNTMASCLMPPATIQIAGAEWPAEWRRSGTRIGGNPQHAGADQKKPTNYRCRHAVYLDHQTG